MTITATDLPSPTIPVTASGPPGTPGTCPGRGGGGSWPGTGNGGGGSAPGGGAWPGTGVVTRGMNGSGRPAGHEIRGDDYDEDHQTVARKRIFLEKLADLGNDRADPGHLPSPPGKHVRFDIGVDGQFRNLLRAERQVPDGDHARKRVQLGG